jgi:NAD(P)-dependent dehydrogenase (short-subunit alcohol dehydrogenase family)
MTAHVPSAFMGRRILVTGAASGIGFAVATALAERGAQLVLVDRDAEALDRARRQFADREFGVFACALDVSDPVAVGAAIAAGTTWTEIHGLVNCAGIYPVTGFLDISAHEWDRVIGINLTGPFLMTQAVARGMVAAGIGGSIVNVSSTASVLARPGIAHYGASKAGLNQLTRVLAVELAPHGIRVNAVLPGVIGTDRVLAQAQSEAMQREAAAKLQRIPLGRVGEPSEVVSLVLFLLSDEASYCTGGLYAVDGGFSLGLSRY